MLTNLKNVQDNFFAVAVFKILKKGYLQILEQPRTIFLLVRFCKY